MFGGPGNGCVVGSRVCVWCVVWLGWWLAGELGMCGREAGCVVGGCVIARGCVCDWAGVAGCFMRSNFVCSAGTLGVWLAAALGV